MKVVSVPISKIKSEGRFREDLGELESLVDSIKEKGLIQPISVDPDFNLLAGGRRLAAAEKAGLKNIDAVVRKTLGELDAREVELMENICRKDMTWQERASLETRIHELQKEKDPEGWSKRQTAELLGSSHASVNRHLALAKAMELIPELREAKTEDDAWKKLKALEEKMVLAELSKRAQKIDKSKYAGDSFNIGDALKGLEKVRDNFIHFAEVDPPYGIELNTMRGRVKDKTAMEDYNEIPHDAYPGFVRTVAKHTFRCLHDNAWCVWWFGTDWQQMVLETLRDVGFQVNVIPSIWYKGATGQTNSPETHLAHSYETFFVARKGRPALRKRGRSNVFAYSPVPARDKIHPTERPIDLMEEILETFAVPGSYIIVPFLGSGVTLRAAYKKEMGGFGWELNESLRDQFLLNVLEDKMIRKEEDG